MRQPSLSRFALTLFSLASLAVQAQDAGMPAASFESLGRTLGGSWTLKVQSEPKEGKPRPAETRGTETWRVSTDGLVLIEEEHLQAPGKELHLLALVWQDRKTQKLAGLVCDSEIPSVCDVKGSLTDISIHWDGAQFVIEVIEHGPDGQTTLWREAYTEITPRSFTQTAESGPPGGPMKRVFTIHATKAKDGAP